MNGHVSLGMGGSTTSGVALNLGEHHAPTGTASCGTGPVHMGTILYRVSVQHVMAWMYGNIGTRTDWWFDGDQLPQVP